MGSPMLLRVVLSMPALAGMLGVTISLAQAETDRDDSRRGQTQGKRGALFVMTNATDATRGNEIAMYRRAADGDLSLVGYFPTGVLDQTDPQLGSGPAPTAQVFKLVDTSLPLVVAAADGLGSSNSLMLSDDKRCLFAVNAGSNTVSSFRVHDDGLQLVSVVLSRGSFPVSLTSHDHLLYVLNAGDASARPAGTTGNHAIDVRVVGDFLYFIQPRSGRVGCLTIGPNGELSDMQHYGGLTPGLEPFAGINPGINHFLGPVNT